MTITWPTAIVLVAIVVVDGALVWHGSLTAHAITGVTSAIVGFVVGRAALARNPESK